MSNRSVWEAWGSFAAMPEKSAAFANKVFSRVSQLNEDAYLSWTDGGDLADGDYPLRYPERGWTGLVAKALLDMNPCSLGELPIEREREANAAEGRKLGGGRVDYWTYFDRSDIGMELKRHHLNLGARPGGYKDIQARWDEVTAQARQALRYMQKSGDFDNPITVAVLALFAFEHVRDRKAGISAEQANEKINGVAHGLGNMNTPWVGVWRPPGGAAVIRLENQFERCPGVYFLAQTYA